MLNRFKNALYGTSTSTDDSSVVVDNEDLIGKKIRSALTRSSSFREDLLSESSRSRAGLAQQNLNGQSSNSKNLFGSLQRGKSQLLRKSTIPEEGSSSGSRCSNLNDNNIGAKSSFNATRRARATSIGSASVGGQKLAKFRYTRPEFLQLRTDDEIIVSADHQIRPIILPRDVARLPWFSGYGECINAGKSLKNEDQAACYQDVAVRLSSLLQHSHSDSIKDQIPWTYFGMFDGHAGTAVAIAAAAQLHDIIGEKLRQIADLLIALEFDLEDREEELEDEFADCQSSPVSSHTETAQNCEPTLDATTASSAEDAQDHTDDGAKSGDKRQEVEKENREEKVEDFKDEAPTCDKHDGSCKSTPPTSRAEAPVSHTPASNKRPPRRLSEHEHSYLPSMIDICRNNVTVDSLIKGTLESAFWEMDELIASDKQDYKMAGGCTAIISVFILGKLYVCNAGDSRAIVYKNTQVIPMSFDFTPTSERERILRLGLARPEFLGNEFTHLEFLKRPSRKDLGKQMLYKDAYMTGWSLKTITYDDLKLPLVWGEGKRSRVLATIGVTRGFGDHELRAQHGSLLIKPFLTPEPEVKVLPLETDDSLTAEDVLIMGTDGLWDVTTNEEAAEIIKRSFDLFPSDDESRSRYRYIWAAQDLVIHSRGLASQWNNVWRTTDDRLASLDDISVFVIPLKPYRDEYLEWRKLRGEWSRSRRRSSGAALKPNANGQSTPSNTPGHPLNALIQSIIEQH